jgi:hypothetical protein
MAYESCSSVTLESIDARCDQSIGGIKRILIANKDDVTGVTLDNSTHQITAITLAQDKTFYEWKFRRNTGSYTSTVTQDVAIGNSFATTEVNLQFSKAEALKRLAIQNAINASAVIIVEALDGEKIYLGYDNEVNITNAVMQSGTANTDLNGFTLTFNDVSKELPYFISPSLDIDSLLV